MEQSFQSYLQYFYPEKAKQYFWNFTHYKRQVQENTFQDLLEEVEGYTTSDKGRMKKALYFLMDHGIHHLADICYPVRKSYETYVSVHYPGRVMAELKELDNLKLWSIQKSHALSQSKWQSSHTKMNRSFCCTTRIISWQERSIMSGIRKNFFSIFPFLSPKF